MPASLYRGKLDRAKRKSKAAQARKQSDRQYELRGANLAAQTNYDPELVLVGSAGTGKTLADLIYINNAMWNYPNLRVLVVRKVRADLAESVLVTYERDILGYDNPICAGVMRENRHAYRYPNGSIMVLAGMDRPGKVLSSEWDIIYVPEATQLTENDWETLKMRVGRTGDFPYPQLRADTNPDRPDHWLKKRAEVGMTTMLTSFHRDNPAYWDGKLGTWTPAGVRYVVGTLAKLTGVRKLRFFDGIWAAAEGMVYEEWNDAIHEIDSFPIPIAWRRIRAVDFGFSNPFVCLWGAVDPDGRIYIYRQIYKTRRLVEEHTADIIRLSKGEVIEKTVTDHDAEDRATMDKHGVKTTAARKGISVGIQALQSRMQVQPDGKARFYVFKDSLVERDLDLEDGKKPMRLSEEFPGYVWADTKKKEVPVDEDNHALDALRYLVMAVDYGVHETPQAEAVSYIGRRRR